MGRSEAKSTRNGALRDGANGEESTAISDDGTQLPALSSARAPVAPMKHAERAATIDSSACTRTVNQR
jgi:hypothetical protein